MHIVKKYLVHIKCHHVAPRGIMLIIYSVCVFYIEKHHNVVLFQKK